MVTNLQAPGRPGAEGGCAAGRSRAGNRLVRQFHARARKRAGGLRDCRRGRPGTSAGSAGRWQPLRGGRAEGGPGRRPGGGAVGGRPARASSADARPAPGCWATRRLRLSCGQSGYGPSLGLPDRPPGRRVAAGHGPQRAAAPGDGGAAVLLPGERSARVWCSEPSAALSVPRAGAGERLGKSWGTAGGVSAAPTGRRD